MIIHNEKRKFVIFGTVLVGIILAILFIFFSKTFHKPQLVQSLVLILYSLLGIALIFAASMFLSTDSRLTSLLFGSIFLIITINYFRPELLYLESMGIGCIIGGIISFYILYNNRFDLLAIASRGLLTIFFLVVVGMLIGSYFNEMNELSLIQSGEITSEIGTQTLFTHLIGILFAILAYLFLFYSIVGVKSSDIFVFGPRGSGKTYFMMAFFEHITNKNMKAKLKDEFILSVDDNAKAFYSFGEYAEKLLRGKEFGSTPPYTLIIYQFYAKIGLFRPVTWTFLDYAGEHMPEISEKKFKESIKYLAQETKLSESDLEKISGTIQFCKHIENNFRKNLVVAEFREALITAAFHGYIQNAGKIIFLADGGKVINEKINESDSRPLLAKEFVFYSKVLNSLETGNFFNFMGARKKFCIVVTLLA